MSTDSIQKPLKVLGVTLWQVIVTLILAGFYLGEMKPRLEAAEKLAASVIELNRTVQGLATRVEVHAVTINSISALQTAVSVLQIEVAKLQPKTANN